MSDELCTEGLQFILEAAMTEEQSVPANFYIGLCTDVSVAEDASLADLTELSGNNYSRQTVASDNVDLTSATAGTNDRKVTTKTVTFTASGGAWSGAVHAFIGTTVDDSGKLVAVAALSATRTLQDGDSLQVSMVIQLNG
jgi:hypothetical protein